MTIDFPNAVDVQNAGGRDDLIFLVDHARYAMPDFLDGLGVPADVVKTHIGWDIGIEGVSRILSDRMSVPSVYCLYSRLIIDVNRPPGHPELIRPVSDEVPIQGNMNLSDEARRVRLSQIFAPFHAAARDVVERARIASNDRTIVVAMHSCTPMLREEGTFRPWEIGLSTYDSHEAMENLASALEQQGLSVGRHEPYDIRELPGSTLDRHAREKGLVNILVEIRQDGIGDAEGHARWADILQRAFCQAFNLDTMAA